MIFASQKSALIILIRHLPLAGATFPHLGKVRVGGSAYNITAVRGSVHLPHEWWEGDRRIGITIAVMI